MEMQKEQWMQAKKAQGIHEVKFGNLERLKQTMHKSKSTECLKLQKIGEEQQHALRRYDLHSPITFTIAATKKYNYYL